MLMSEDNTSMNKKKIIAAVVMIAIILPLGIYFGAFYDLKAPEMIVLNGDHILDGDYVVEKGQNVTFQKGTFTFADPESCVKVYGVFNGLDLTLVGNIEVYDEGRVNIVNSPHTVEEIYAYNTSQVTITNSIVHKVYAYDSATILIDDDVFYGTEDHPNVIYGDIMALINDLNATLIALQQQMDQLPSEDYKDEIQALNDTIVLLSNNLESLNGTMLNINTTLSDDMNNLESDLALLEARITALENPGDFTAPLVGILDPDDGEAYWGNISVRAMIWEESDYSVEILINGSVNSTILPFTWDTGLPQFGDGWWNLSVRVTDENNNIGQDEIVIKIQSPSEEETGITGYWKNTIISPHSASNTFNEIEGFRTTFDVQESETIEISLSASFKDPNGGKMNLRFSIFDGSNTEILFEIGHTLPVDEYNLVSFTMYYEGYPETSWCQLITEVAMMHSSDYAPYASPTTPGQIIVKTITP